MKYSWSCVINTPNNGSNRKRSYHCPYHQAAEDCGVQEQIFYFFKMHFLEWMCEGERHNIYKVSPTLEDSITEDKIHEKSANQYRTQQRKCDKSAK